jgi:phosphomannomutase
MNQLIMSMSGTRGVIGDTLSPQIALKMGMAFGALTGKGPVIVGGDTRTSHTMVKSAVIAGLTSVGTDVIDIGKVPTPTVQQMIRHFKAAGGLVITASHNPVIWNGIKMMNDSGSFLDDNQYKAFMALYESDTFPLAAWDAVGQVRIETHALDLHVDLVLSHFDVNDIRQANLKVIVDANNGAGAVADPILLQRLGVQYLILNNEPNGHFAHDPEPLRKNLNQIIHTMRECHYDIGFVQDADADRLVILDETGHFIGEDYSLGMCIDYILSEETDPNKKVVVNLSTSQVVEWIASKYQAKLFYTKIGETNVTQTIKSEQAHVGGEGNGGVIFPKVGWGRDSLVGIVVALKYLAKSKQKVSQIVSQYPKYTMLREKVSVSTREQVQQFLQDVTQKFPGCTTNTEDGVKILLENSWVHVRPSNTEPIIRIFVEAPSDEQAKALFAQATA